MNDITIVYIIIIFNLIHSFGKVSLKKSLKKDTMKSTEINNEEKPGKKDTMKSTEINNEEKPGKKTT